MVFLWRIDLRNKTVLPLITTIAFSLVSNLNIVWINERYLFIILPKPTLQHESSIYG